MPRYSISRILLGALGATVAYFALGFVLLAILPLDAELGRYRAVYRPEESMMGAAPVGMAALLLAMVALATLHAWAFPGGASPRQAVRFGLVVGVFAAGSFLLHNYVSLNIGLRLALLQTAAHAAQVFGAGVAAALIYRRPG